MEDGRIDKQKFLKYLKDPLAYDPLPIKSKANQGESTDDEEYKSLLQTLVGFMIEKEITLANVTEWYRVLDVSKDGTLRLYGL
jgi:hypothetical protein